MPLGSNSRPAKFYKEPNLSLYSSIYLSTSLSQQPEKL